MEEAAKIATVFDDEQEHVGEVFAGAIFSAAGGAGKTDEVCGQLSAIATDLIAGNPKFAAVLSSPRISQDDKLQLIDRVFKDRVDPLLVNFLKVLCKRDRLGFIPSINKAVQELQDEASGRLRIVVTAATEIDDRQADEIESALKARFDANVAIERRVDPNILGGLVIRIGDTVYDSSVSAKLSAAKKSVIEKSQQSLREKFESLISG